MAKTISFRWAPRVILSPVMPQGRARLLDTNDDGSSIACGTVESMRDELLESLRQQPIIGQNPCALVELRETARVNLKQREEAEARAWALLLEHLTPEQATNLKENHFFEIEGELGRYRLWDDGRVHVFHEGRTRFLCINPIERLPNGDVILIKKLMIETDEAQFRAVAGTDWHTTSDPDKRSYLIKKKAERDKRAESRRRMMGTHPAAQADDNPLTTWSFCVSDFPFRLPTIVTSPNPGVRFLLDGLNPVDQAPTESLEYGVEFPDATEEA